MNASIQETCNLLHDLDIWDREITIEGALQLATISQHVKHRIPLIQASLRRLIEYEREAERVRRTYTFKHVAD